MKWSEFVKIGESTLDELLTEKLGIYDNFPILWRADSEESLINELLASGRYQRHTYENDHDSLNPAGERNPWSKLPNWKSRYQRRLAYVPGAVIINQNGGAHTATSRDCESEGVLAFQRTRFNYGLMLHPYQIKKADTTELRTLFNVTRDICESIFIPENLPFCLPKVFFYKQGLNPQDYSTIVYWPDSVEGEMCRKC